VLYNNHKDTFSVKHNRNIEPVIQSLATCFGTSEPSHANGHGAFSECVHYEVPYLSIIIIIIYFTANGLSPFGSA